MKFDRAALKAQAKETMRATKPSTIWVCLVMMIIVAALSILSETVAGNWQLYRRILTDPAWQSYLYEGYGQTGSSMIGWLLRMALDVMGWVVSVGFSIYRLRVWRRQHSGFGDLFDGFGIFFRAIMISLLPSILLSLWSMIYALPVGLMAGAMFAFYDSPAPVFWVFIAGLPLLLPMIIADYAYRQATFLMLDNPGLSCWQCIGLSRRIMRGHKLELFKLDLSFLGWSLLCIVPFVALWVIPYTNITFAGYYEYVLADYTAKNAPPVGPEMPAM